MKKSRYTDNQILSILKQAEAGALVPELYSNGGQVGIQFYAEKRKEKYPELYAYIQDLFKGA